MDKSKLFYTAYEVANLLEVSYQTALSWIKNSGVKYTKVGRSYRVNIDSFNRIIQD